jgi:hypothetical protein
MAFSYWMSFVGNVLGQPGQMSGWTYESQNFGDAAVWMLGWDGWSPYPTDPNIVALTYRHGNFDYLTNTQIWDPAVTNHTLPNSLYLTNKPAFFGSRTWPWVQPEGTTKLFSLPAKDRYDGVIRPPMLDAAEGAGSGSGIITISWDTDLDLIYRLHTSTNLLKSWPSNYLFQVPGDGSRKTYIYSNDAAMARFFRVGVQ